LWFLEIVVCLPDRQPPLKAGSYTNVGEAETHQWRSTPRHGEWDFLLVLDPILEWLSRVPHLDHVPDCDGGEDRDGILTDLCGDGSDTKSPEEDLHIVCRVPRYNPNRGYNNQKMLEDSRLQEVGTHSAVYTWRETTSGEVILDSDSQNARRVLEVDELRKIVKQVS